MTEPAPEPEVWPVLIHDGHGEGTDLLGVYATREDAFRAIKAQPNMTAYVDDKGEVHGRPVRERTGGELLSGRSWFPVRWAHGSAEKVQRVAHPVHADGGCTCPHKLQGRGVLYGSSLGPDWVRMADDPACPHHGASGGLTP